VRGFLLCNVFIDMKKVIRLTESDLVNIVKRVINEQTENGPVINKDTKIEIPSDVLSQFQKYKFNNVESGGTFLDKINQDSTCLKN
jgi:hypothetical protein